MPLRPHLLDLREYLLCERPMRFLLSLKRMAPDERLLVVCDHDPSNLLGELKPVLEKEFTCWVTEEGPQIWRILISRPADRSHIKGDGY